MVGGIAQLARQHAVGEPLRKALPVFGPRCVGRTHRLQQRERIELPAMLGELCQMSEAKGDQRAASRRRRIERDLRLCVPPQQRRAALNPVTLEIVAAQMAAERARLLDDGRGRYPRR